VLLVCSMSVLLVPHSNHATVGTPLGVAIPFSVALTDVIAVGG